MVSPSTSIGKVVIAGGTGFLGQLLAQSFIDDSWEVVLLSRSRYSSSKVGRIVYWDAHSSGAWVHELEGADVLLNLTGRSIDCRHTSSNRKEIIDSRIYSTQVLGKAVASCVKPPLCWMNASSMALYGQCFGDKHAHDEYSAVVSQGFLEEVTLAWENEFFEYKREGVRQIALRISFILGYASGAFPLLKKLSSLGMGGMQGTGMQWMSWLHEDDWTGIVRFLIDQKNITGAVNLASPHPVINKEFMRILRKCSAPFGFGFPAPSIGVQLGCYLLGSAPELALQSRKVVSKRLAKLNYPFKYPDISLAIAHLAGN